MVLINVNRPLKGIDLNSMIPGASLIVLDANRNVILSTEKDLDLVGILNDVYFNPSQEASSRTTILSTISTNRTITVLYISINCRTSLKYRFRHECQYVDYVRRDCVKRHLVGAASIYLYRPVKNIVHCSEAVL